MFRKFIRRCRWRLALPASATVLWSNTGCSFGDAVVDGFFGSVSDTIASVITTLALGAVGG